MWLWGAFISSCAQCCCWYFHIVIVSAAICRSLGMPYQQQKNGVPCCLPVHFEPGSSHLNNHTQNCTGVESVPKATFTTEAHLKESMKDPPVIKCSPGRPLGNATPGRVFEPELPSPRTSALRIPPWFLSRKSLPPFACSCGICDLSCLRFLSGLVRSKR